ncbi:MAG: alpha/beta fold hydrolase [Janthinobacterium lividum]
MSDIHYRTQAVGDVEVFYRETGPADAPVILLLHGFPTSSHMFRDLMPALSDRYRLIAPDLPGFGLTKAPPRGSFTYSFDALAEVVGGFVDAIGFQRYALYIFDYGAPTGLRLAMKHPERVTAIITQNGNAYVEGFSKDWAPWEAYWREPTPAHREATRASLSDEAIRFQYEHGAPSGRVSPDGSMLDMFYMHRPEAEEIQLDLILSYRTNVALYPDFQSYFRRHRPPVLAVWGKNDPFFLPPGAEAYRRDVPDAEIHLLDAGHFALETHHREIADKIREFLGRKLASQ